MAVNVSAGVYKKEIDRSQRLNAIQATIGGLVGHSKRGPVGKPTLVTSPDEFISLFGEPSPGQGYFHYCALQFLAESSRLMVTRTINNATQDALTAGAVLTVDDLQAVTPNLSLNVWDTGVISTGPSGKFDPKNTFGFTPQDTNTLLAFYAVDPGEWNSEIYIQVRPLITAGSSTPADPYTFKIEVYLNYQGVRDLPVESFSVSRVEGAVDGFGRSTYIEDVINRKSAYIRAVNNKNVAPVKILQNAFVFLDGGTSGTRPTDSDYVLAWEIYRDPEKMDVNVLINGGLSSVAVQQKMDDVARSRMDCIAVLDMPSDSQSTSAALDYRKNVVNIDSSYSAIYSSDCLVYDPFNDLELYVPPSGLVSAAYARTDSKFELWFAPAGMIRGKLRLRGLRHKYNQGQRDALDEANINTIRFIPGKGYNIWGQETMQTKKSALSNVNVRRLLCYVEKTIAVGALYSVFDPGDVFLRASLVELCERFLNPIKRGRGLYWFSVVCDETNNSPASVASGDIYLDVYVDPTIAAKRIHLQAVIVKTGASFKEAAAQVQG
jgi:Phage tail sheath protein subtilisin-like domain